LEEVDLEEERKRREQEAKDAKADEKKKADEWAKRIKEQQMQRTAEPESQPI